MKFAEHLSSHITPEWRKQYLQYEAFKDLLYAAQDQAPSIEGVIQDDSHGEGRGSPTSQQLDRGGGGMWGKGYAIDRSQVQYQQLSSSTLQLEERRKKPRGIYLVEIVKDIKELGVVY
ncbi:unnamed protein product [Coregonus sp. 'balchen']|nr:unnamed protein product [Coregonus sp. 'balchen']